MRDQSGFKRTGSRGYTLVEILVVIALIGILAGISTVAVNSVLASGRDKATKTRIELLDSVLTEFLSDDPMNITELEEADGSGLSSKKLYGLLSGDVEPMDGERDADYAAEAILLPQLLPPRDKEGNIDFLSPDCWLRPVALDSDGNWDFIEVAPTKTLPDNFAIVDAFSRPIRFFYKVETDEDSGLVTRSGGNKNTGREGFDIWSAGRDGETLDDSGATPSSANGMKDDIKNW